MINNPGVNEFIDLKDVPVSYTGAALQAVTVNSGETALVFTTSSGGNDWDRPFGDTVFTYDVSGNVETKTVGSVVLTFTYDMDGNVDTISDGINVKTFAYDVSGNVEFITYS
jgi:hypothetical protein